MKRLLLIAVASAALLAAKPHKDGYVLSAEEGISFSSGTSLEEWREIHTAHPGNMLWVRRNGRSYLIRDETTILRARALFGPQLALGPEQEAVSREESQLDHEADRLEDKEDARTPAEEKRLAELREKLRIIARREKELDEKEEALEREAERAFWPLIDSAIRAGTAKPLGR